MAEKFLNEERHEALLWPAAVAFMFPYKLMSLVGWVERQRNPTTYRLTK